MNTHHTRFTLESDRGFTLVEVLVAMVIISILGLSAAYLAINGTQASSSLQRESLATTVAVQAVEDVASRHAGVEPASGVSGLVNGRTEGSVMAAWEEYSHHSIGETMYPLFDSTADEESVPNLPIFSTRTLSGTEYTVVTLIGSCYRSAAFGQCGPLDGVEERPDTSPSGHFEVIRVAVIVEWTAGRACAENPCSFELVTLIDASPDYEWVDNG